MPSTHWQIEQIPASDGTLSVRVNGKMLHSKVSPLKEAERWAQRVPEAATVIVVGAGLGYGVVALLSSRPGLQVVVLEPVADLIPLQQQLLNEKNLVATILAADTRIDASKKLSEILAQCGTDFVIVEGFPGASDWDRSGIVDRLHYAKNLKRNPPRVLVVSPIYGGSYPISQYVNNALKELGCHVEFMDNSHLDSARKEIDELTERSDHRTQLSQLLLSFAAERVTAKAIAMRADLVLGLAQAPINTHVWEELRNIGIATAFWFVEDHYLFPYGNRIAQVVDAFFAIQRDEWYEQLEKSSAKMHYLPLAADLTVHHTHPLTDEQQQRFGAPVTFVGAGYYNRRNAFLSLSDVGIKIWGDGWGGSESLQRSVQENGRRVSTEEAVTIFQASSVNINLHSSTYHQDIAPDGDFVNPRTFELSATGAFQVIDHRSLLSELFTDDELPAVTTLEAMRAQIHYALNDSGFRAQQIQKTHQRVINDHTYPQRMEELLGYVYRNRIPLSHQELGQLSLRNWLESETIDPRVKEYLERFSGRTQVTLSEIADEIERRREKLSQTEAVFMLLHEFYKWGKNRGVI